MAIKLTDMDGAEWEPGTLTTHAQERMLTDLLAEVWSDVYRRETEPLRQQTEFRRRMETAIYAATGREMWLRNERR